MNEENNEATELPPTAEGLNQTMDSAPTPSIGRIVHFYDTSERTDPIVAVVTRVWSPTCVNLHLLPDANDGEVSECVTSVTHGRPGVGYTWCWPPRF